MSISTRTAAVPAAASPRTGASAAPSGSAARIRANLAAVETLHILQAEDRATTPDERAILARWSGWGAVPAVFDPKAADYARFALERARLKELLNADEYAAAQRNTLNAHYTDPAYVQAIWKAARELGFEQGRVLEPGCGSGNFLGHASERDHVIGVELDPTTAAIASKLHPRADVRAESFAETRLAEGSVDLVVGNVPFGDIRLHDRRHNQGGHAIHNHFLVKSLHLTRPGGLTAVITSRYTMDAKNPAARRELAELGDLVGAVRLPTGSHRRTAGTDVVTDVLIFRRREPGHPPGGFAFEQAMPTPVTDSTGSDATLHINQYFLEHPEHVLGSLRADQGDQGRLELGVLGDRDAGPALEAALSNIVARAREQGLTRTPHTIDLPEPTPLAVIPTSVRKPEGFIARVEGGFTRVEEGAAIAYQPASSQAKELTALLGLRDTVVTLLESEASTLEDTPVINTLRQQLNDQYDAYVAAHGALNRFSERRTGRIDPDTGEERLARVRPAQGGFRVDPFANVVYALEHFDAATQTATKATIFRERVVSRRPLQLGADTPADALAICLDHFGEARISEVARLLGVDEPEARRQLDTLVFDEPSTGRLVPAAEYLSGNVREKLHAALSASEHDARFAANVDALTRVIPPDLGPADIHARLGAAWIDASHVRDFLRETLEDTTLEVEHPGGALWAVRSDQRRSIAATSKWGTERLSAIDIAQALLEQRQIRIYDESPEGQRTFNESETIAANEKARELGERFSEWVWEKPERATALAREYNDRFNAIVPRSYDDAQLSLPGLALSFKPRPHQVAAVARIIHEPAVGLFHEVGAGKTAEMVMGAMELKRLGLVQKPVVVVPNHMLDQFSREWLQLYPQAKLLAASKDDLDREHRRLFVAKCATGDWDAIVMTRSAFERIPMSLEAQEKYLRSEIDELTSMAERAKASDSRFTLKRLERMRLAAEERLKSKLDGAKDPGITFEQLGIDYVFVDEAHAYKNLRTTSNIPGMAVDGSQRASDLHMKLAYLRAKQPRVGTLATATPLANSMGEAYTMQRYLRPDLLQRAGIRDFDTWAATFGETTTAIEVAPDGSGMRMQTRFSRFRNVPELLLQWRVSADIKTGEDLKLPVPPLAARPSDGQRLPETVVVAPSPELKEYVAELAQRADRVRSRSVDPSEDNLLAISSDGRAAGLDLRLLGLTTDAPQKAEVAAQRITDLYHANRDKLFPGPDGSTHPVPGALQLVFSDLGTPKPGAWSEYEHLRSKLVTKGIPRTSIRFIHEAKNDREKGELFAACRDGRVAVLIGSTERMGVGTNVQLRAVALHHLDCPWRPADIAQREGRILRQGNANPEVQILRYVTEGSFDAYLWQTVTRKAQFIGQVMRGRLDVREIDEIGEAALSYNEVKALATGNPLLLEHAAAQAEVSRLERLQRSHQHSQASLAYTAKSYAERLGRLDQRIVDADSALKRLAGMDERFEMVVGNRAHSKRTEANEHLREVMQGLLERRGRSHGPVQVGSFHGLPLIVQVEPAARAITLSMRGVPGSEISLDSEALTRAALLTRLQNSLQNLPSLREADVRQRARLAAELGRAREQLGAPFPKAEQLAAARLRLGDLDKQLAAFVALAAASPEQTSTLPTPEQREEQGRALTARWNDLLAQEEATVRNRAAALDPRLAVRETALQERLANHVRNMPTKPSSLSMLTGARSAYELALAEWRGEHARLSSAVRCVRQRKAAVNAYAAPSAPGCPTKASQLAAKRVGDLYPELAEQLAECSAWRQERERDERGSKLERGRVDTARSLER